MQLRYIPKTNLEKFGFKIYFLLVENFPQTFFVGGTVRDILLGRKVTDIDIATSAIPEKVAKLLSANGIQTNLSHKNFGIVVAKKGSLTTEVATFRKDIYLNNRYPKVSFIKSAKTDSNRRDFTINFLYFSPKHEKILDFHKGLLDLNRKTLRFINSPNKSIKEDPLRIIRAVRFAEDLNLKIEPSSKKAIIQNFEELKKISYARIKTEIEKAKNKKTKKRLQKLLDKHAKNILK